MSDSTHLVLIPSYDTGPRLLDTVKAALAQWTPVWVVIDGSTDGSGRLLDPLLDPAHPDHAPGLRVITLDRNSGKGAALLVGLTEALQAGYSHALTMDSDGQHPADLITDFMARSKAEPDAMILGRPVFDASAPALRVRGRRISNRFADIETFGFAQVGGGDGPGSGKAQASRAAIAARSLVSSAWASGVSQPA